MDFLKKFLPQQVQDFLPQIEEALKDKSVAQDLMIALDEVEKEIRTAAKHPATDKSLKDAFNDAANCIPCGKHYLNGDKMRLAMAATKIPKSADRFKKIGQVIGDAGKAQHPATVALTQNIKDNKTFSEAIKRLVTKTNGKLFTLEDGENGQGCATELLTGKNMKFVIEKKDYEEIKKALGLGDVPPAPPAPKPPSAPGSGL